MREVEENEDSTRVTVIVNLSIYIEKMYISEPK